MQWIALPIWEGFHHHTMPCHCHTVQYIMLIAVITPETEAQDTRGHYEKNWERIHIPIILIPFFLLIQNFFLFSVPCEMRPE